MANPSSTFPTTVTGVTVETATAGALSGDGSSGDKLAVSVNGTTVDVNGSDQLEVIIGGSDTQVQFNDSGVFGGDAGLTYNKTATALTFGGFPSLRGITDDANNGENALVLTGSSSTPELIIAESYTNSQTYSGLNIATYDSGGDVLAWLTTIKDGATNGQLALYSPTIVFGATTTEVAGRLLIGTGQGISPEPITGHTALIQAYDVDGAAYKTFATLTSGNTPDFTIAIPSGGTVNVQASDYKASDGTSGVTAGPFTTISSITVTNGLITAITGV